MSQINIFDEITVDGFCGGGGWSTGFELGIGCPVRQLCTASVCYGAGSGKLAGSLRQRNQYYGCAE